jgi:hypothetical protein
MDQASELISTTLKLLAGWSNVREQEHLMVAWDLQTSILARLPIHAQRTVAQMHPTVENTGTTGSHVRQGHKVAQLLTHNKWRRVEEQAAVRSRWKLPTS